MKWIKINESVLQNEVRDFSRYGDSPEVKEKAQKIAKRIFSRTKEMRDALKEYEYASSSEIYRDLNTVGHVRITVYLTPSDNIYGGHYKSVIQFEASNNRGIGGWTANIRDDGTLRIGSSVFADEVFEVLDTFKRFEKDFWNGIDQLDKDEMDTAYTESNNVKNNFVTESDDIDYDFLDDILYSAHEISKDLIDASNTIREENNGEHNYVSTKLLDYAESYRSLNNKFGQFLDRVIG